MYINPNTVTIKISGPAGAGKTRLLRTIGAMLQSQGVYLQAFDDVSPGRQGFQIFDLNPVSVTGITVLAIAGENL